MTEKLIVLGTGNASALRCYNTCFVLTDGTQSILVDGGGGNGLFTMARQAGVDLSQIHYAFLTHCHSDHLFGMIWMLRHIATQMQKGTYVGDFKLFCHSELAEAVRTITKLSLSPSMSAFLDHRILLEPVADGETRRLADYDVTFFDIHSTKARQYGFSLRLHNGKRLVFLGDEPCQPALFPTVEKADWLLAEAFCLYAERDIFKPYEKHHSTVREACACAEQLHVQNLVLWHTEDSHLPDRKTPYTEEANSFFSGNIFVPDDLETIIL